MSRVVIVGAGLGGLALAHGLERAGIETVLLERDRAPRSRLQGYRLSLTPHGLQALRQVLPDELWRKILAACTPPLPGIAFVSQRLELRFFRPTPDQQGEADGYRSISREALRTILLEGLEDRVRFGEDCTGFSIDAGRVRPLGVQVDEPFDLLVGADGTHSRIRRQLLRVDNRVETGVSAIAGKVPLAPGEAAARLASPIGESAVVIGDEPQGLFIANHRLEMDDRHDDYVFWSFLTRHDRFAGDVADADAERLLKIVDAMTPGWHPRLKDLVHDAKRKEVLLLNYATSRTPEPWADVSVTLIGDAIHNMPPTGGEGANMALRDAAVLTQVLTSSTGDLRTRLNDYRRAMFDYAFKAVDYSMTNLARMVDR